MQRFVKNQFNSDQVTTVGAAFLQSPVPLDDSEDKIQFGIWDTAGSERYKALAPMYYRGAEAAIIVYDITSFESFGAPPPALCSRAEASSPSFAAPPLPARPMLLDSPPAHPLPVASRGREELGAGAQAVWAA